MFEPMKKGQVENLFPILEELLKRQSVLWSQLNAIAVGIGPGNFTGIRLSVSAARGLALSLGIPAIAISNFEILEALSQKKKKDEQVKILSLQGPGASAYIQIFKKNTKSITNFQINLKDINLDIPVDSKSIIIGYKAKEIAKDIGCKYINRDLKNIPINLVKIAKRKFLSGVSSKPRPTPLYIRGANAESPKNSKLKVFS